MLVVLVCFVLAVIIIAGLVRWFMRFKKRQKQERTTCFFKMDRSNVSFVSLGSGILVSQRCVELEGKLSLTEEHRELPCIGNESKHKLKVQLLVNSRNFEKAAFRVSPEVAILEKGMACEFRVVVTLHCTAHLTVHSLC